ncbi:MAG: uroporphyrinogen-III C-methyltransferase [Gammaproteobacteria bacterium]|nr:uroporphyrinogen-III C-methyltransferase [Gammaproteobacteria bacterium]
MSVNGANARSATVYLVGAGPGDPDLLTVKAMRLLKSADVVVYDRLISDAILDEVPAGATRVYVGKQDGHHHMSQSDINALLVALARRHQVVVRLKGGDPFIFGRGSEEALFLARHGIAFEIVPGVTAASGCTAYAGIPLTHRALSRQVLFITGRCSGAEPPHIETGVAADEQCTLVIYMGLRQLPAIVERLLAAGRPPATPVAVIENGSLPSQRRCLGRLDQLSEQVREAGIQSPALVVVGRVVELAPELDWFQPWAGSAHAPCSMMSEVAGV